MNKNFNSKASGRGVDVNTWIIIFLIVIAVHLIIILGIGGFKLLKNGTELLKNKGIQASKGEKSSIEQPQLNFPPEENHSLKSDIPEPINPLTTDGTDNNGNKTAPPPVDINKLLASLDQSSGNASASATSVIAPAAVGTFAKPAKTVGSPESSGNSYVVVEGDTLWKIAAKTGGSVDDIRKNNSLAGDMIRVGQKLIITEKSNYKALVATINDQSNLKQPVNASGISEKLPAVSSDNCKSYHIEKGDTLNKIATLFRISPGKLAKFNNISDPRKLKVGMEIKVPKE
jgi:LysM repeat protein